MAFFILFFVISISKSLLDNMNKLIVISFSECYNKSCNFFSIIYKISLQKRKMLLYLQLY